jgi:hypothetical protein
MSTQYILIRKGAKIGVVLPVKVYNKMIQELEDIEDIKLYDNAKAMKGRSIGFKDYLKQRL